MDTIEMNCRFCSKLFDEQEDIYEISNDIKQLFEDLTNTKLVLSIIEKSYTCRKCLKSMHAANFVKNRFIVNQELMMAVDRFECESKMEIDDFILEQYKTSPVKENGAAKDTENPPKKLKLSDTSSDSSYVPSPEIKAVTTADTMELNECYICNRRMKDLRTHMFSYHKNDLPTCDKCGKIFYKKESLEQHLINQYLRRRFPCPYCPKSKPKSYLTNGSLRFHIKIKHPEVQRP